MKKTTIFSICVMVSFLFFSCESGKDKKRSKAIEDKLEVTIDTADKVIKFEQTLFSIPSPYQLSVLVKEIGAGYNELLLNVPTRYTQYNNTFKKSINLGVYGADLAYANAYEQSPIAVKYFSVIKLLTQDLGLTSAIDVNVFDRIEHNVTNKDSLMYIISNTYADVDFFLKENQRQKDGALILVGGWIESMYLLSHLAVETKNKDLIKRLGENKQPLNSLIKVMTPYYHESDEMAKLIDNLVDLSYEFDEVQSEYTYIEPEVIADNKLTKVKSKSDVVVSDEVLNKIAIGIKKIREEVVK